MSATDPVVTLAFFLKFAAPDGDVRLCDGGMLEYASEVYEAWHPVFGAIHESGAAEDGAADAAEDGSLVLAPSPDADLADWWRSDLFDCRLQIWMGELEADGFTVLTATPIHDLLVDSYERLQGAGGEDLLAIDLIGRAEKLFLVNEGNVCSERFHKTVFAGENGFNNCTDLVGFVAWGAASPPRSGGGTRGGGSGGGSRPVLR